MTVAVSSSNLDFSKKLAKEWNHKVGHDFC